MAPGTTQTGLGSSLGVKLGVTLAILAGFIAVASLALLAWYRKRRSGPHRRGAMIGNWEGLLRDRPRPVRESDARSSLYYRTPGTLHVDNVSELTSVYQPDTRRPPRRTRAADVDSAGRRGTVLHPDDEKDQLPVYSASAQGLPKYVEFPTVENDRSLVPSSNR